LAASGTTRDVLYIAGGGGSTGRSGGGEALEIEAARRPWFLELQDTDSEEGAEEEKAS